MSRHSDPASKRLSPPLSADYLDFIKRFSRKLAGRRLGDDLAHEALARVLDKLPRFLENSRQGEIDHVPRDVVRSWIGGVVWRVWKEMQRRAGRESPASPGVEIVPQSESSISLDESKRHIRECLRVIYDRDPAAYEVLALVVRYGSARKAAESGAVTNFWRRYNAAINLLKDVYFE